jgi:hypothetical protein
MPSTSAKQAKFMRAVANSPKFAKKVGVPQSVGKDYEMADKKRKKFSQGGRAEAARDRRMADIEKDYQRAIAKGKSEKEAKAKRDQRIADARDDYAKRTGADRTETRAAEKAAEARLSAARRGVDKDMKPVSVLSGGDKSLAVKADMPKVDTPDLSAPAPKKAEPTPTRRRATASAPAPTRRRPAAPAFDTKALRALEAEVTRPSRDRPATVEKESIGRQMAGTSARRQQSQIDELGGTLRGLFSPFMKNKYSERKAAGGKVKKYAKGGKIDGIAIRGKTRLKRKK